MLMTEFAPIRMTKYLIAALVALTLAVGTTTPTQTRAGGEEILGAIILLGAACAVSGACKGKNKRKKNANAGRSAGPTDAAALDKSQRRLIQEGLASAGFYSGAIDGSFGKGTRQSIRNYQASVGEKANGVLTGAQINRLAAMSPAYASLPADSPLLFETDLARDVDKEGVRSIQASLNNMGYVAGPEDGAMGGKTRSAITAYKLDRSLPGGPIPTGRLLSHMTGVAFAGAGAGAVGGAEDGERLALAEDGALGADQGRAKVETETLSREVVAEPTEAVAPGLPLNFEILGMRPGMSRRSIESLAAEALEGDIHIATGTAEQFGGAGALTLGHVVSQDAWPTPGTQQLVSFYDAEAPGEGAVAIFRTIMMPEDATEEDFQRETVPALLEAYGADGLIDGTLTWIGDGPRRMMARADGATLAACGTLRLRDVPGAVTGADVGWDAGKAPVIDADTVATTTADCGDVLSVHFADHAIHVGLWDANRAAAALVEAGAVASEEPVKKLPKVKF